MKQKKLIPDEIENVSPHLDKMLYRIEKIYQNNLSINDVEVYRKWWHVEDYFRKNQITMEDIKRLIQFGGRFREMKGPGRNRIEESFFNILIRVLFPINNTIPYDEPPFPINRDEIDKITEKKIRELLRVFLEIEKFAIDSYHYQKARDSFGGKRRGFALEIAKYFLNYFQYITSPGKSIWKTTCMNN
jgi:hypothetical protein